MGTVRKGKAAEGSAGSGSGSREDLESTIYELTADTGPAIARIILGGYDQPPLVRAESNGEVRMETGMDTRQRERQDNPATGAESAGDLSDADASNFAGRVRALGGSAACDYARGLHRASRLRTPGDWQTPYACGFADGCAEQDRETARRPYRRAMSALFIGAALGAILLAVAQAILGR